MNNAKALVFSYIEFEVKAQKNKNYYCHLKIINNIYNKNVQIFIMTYLKIYFHCLNKNYLILTQNKLFLSKETKF